VCRCASSEQVAQRTHLRLEVPVQDAARVAVVEALQQLEGVPLRGDEHRAKPREQPLLRCHALGPRRAHAGPAITFMSGALAPSEGYSCMRRCRSHSRKSNTRYTCAGGQGGPGRARAGQGGAGAHGRSRVDWRVHGAARTACATPGPARAARLCGVQLRRSVLRRGGRLQVTGHLAQPEAGGGGGRQRCEPARQPSRLPRPAAHHDAHLNLLTPAPAARRLTALRCRAAAPAGWRSRALRERGQPHSDGGRTSCWRGTADLQLPLPPSCSRPCDRTP
jgi:hypothetical protein